MHDPEETTTYGVAAPELCQGMADKYGWTLISIQESPSTVLPVECLFEGDCKFPPGPLDLRQPQED